MTNSAVIQPESGPERRPFASALRPCYFAGQLLQASDLNKVIEWSRDGFAEARHRDGWGIAGGLELTADPRGRPDAVVVRSGYALDAAGRSIVLGRSHTEELGPHWLKVWKEAPPASDALPPFSGAVAFALTLHHRETESASRPVLAACQGGRAPGSSQPTRVEDGYEIRVEPVADGPDPVAAEAARWETGWTGTLALLRALGDGLISGNGHPLRRLPALEALIREPSSLVFLSDRTRVVELLFWMVQDYRAQFLDDTAAAATAAGQGVRLGRLWLAATPEQPKTPRLLAVDNAAPWRRRRDAARWPAPAGKIAAAGLTGRSLDETAAELARAGLPVAWAEPVDLSRCDSLEALQELLDGQAFARPGEAQVLSVLSRPGEAPLVIGTRPAEPAPWAGLHLEAGADHLSAQPGETVTLWAELRNTGLTVLTAGAEDGLTGVPVIAARRLPPTGMVRSEWQWQVPHTLEPDDERVWRLANGNLRVLDTVRAFGRPDSGDDGAEDTATVELLIEEPLGLRLHLVPIRASALPGGLARFTLHAVNTGRVALAVTARIRAGDGGDGEDAFEHRFLLAPDRRHCIEELEFRTPRRADGYFAVSADATGNVTGRTPGDLDLRRTRATAICTIPVRDPRYCELPLVPWLVWLRLRAWWRRIGS